MQQIYKKYPTTDEQEKRYELPHLGNQELNMHAYIAYMYFHNLS